MPIHFSDPTTVLRDAPPESVGLLPAPIAAAVREIRCSEKRTDAGRPAYPSAVGLMGLEGRVVATDVSGHSYLWQDATTLAPPQERVLATRGTVYDLASVSKLFTSIVVVQLVEAATVRLDAPVATYLPQFGASGKADVTVRQLLTHTSGLVAELPLWSAYDTHAERIRAVMDQPLDDPPGTVYRYSDLNLISLGVMVERLTGQRLDRVVHERVTAPLGMDSTGYNPLESFATTTQVAATEYQSVPARGLVRGEVHDENAWSLGGVAGHAGVFSTVDDLAVLCQTLLNGGVYRGRRILTEQSVREMVTDDNGAFPGDAHGLGFELDQRWYMQGMSSPVTAGHTGYTGTSVVVDFDAQAFVVLLTNRVHPSRDGASTNPARRAWAQGLALAQPARGAARRTAWLCGGADASTAALTAPLRRPAPSSARVSFSAWLEEGASDQPVLEATSDGSTWTAVPVDLRDRGVVRPCDGGVDLGGPRRWLDARGTLPAGTNAVRWRRGADVSTPGRRVLVDDVRVAGREGVLLDGERDPFSADGWEVVRG